MFRIKHLFMGTRIIMLLCLALLAAMPHDLAAQERAASGTLPPVSPTTILSPVAIYQQLAPSAA